ncbi:MAG: hypothetical protein ACTSX6_08095 [Candidatus Heimdallarchaeaceae archaeon]
MKNKNCRVCKKEIAEGYEFAIYVFDEEKNGLKQKSPVCGACYLDWDRERSKTKDLARKNQK